ncbi:MAG: hypothetical protein RRZ92_02255 [Bacilli bacterium]
MKAIFFILKKKDLLDSLIEELKNNGITGGTIIESKGMARTMVETDEFAIFGALRNLLNEEYKSTTTLLFVASQIKEKIILDSIEKICGKLDEPNTGILFALPVEYAKGIKF